MGRPGGWCAWGAVVLAGLWLGGCAGEAPKTEEKAAPLIKQLSPELEEVAVFKDAALTERDFSIPTTESVELLAAVPLQDPDTGRTSTVYQIKWREKTGYVPQDALKR